MQAALVNMDELEECLRDLKPPLWRGASTQQPPMDPGIYVLDSGKAWEIEYHLYPEASRDEFKTHLYNQVWDMLQKMQERLNKQTWNREVKDLVDRLISILEIQFRINKLNEKVSDQVRKGSGQ